MTGECCRPMLRFRGRVLIELLIALAVATAAHADTASKGTPASKEDQPESGMTRSDILRELERFKPVSVSLREALSIVQKRRAGSRVVDASFDSSAEGPVYRVKTNRDKRIWEDSVDANSGGVVGAATESSLDDLEGGDRQLLLRLRVVHQELLDAIVVAERDTSGKAISAGLAMDGGRLQFIVVCLVGRELKQVLLEPPGTIARSKK